MNRYVVSIVLFQLFTSKRKKKQLCFRCWMYHLWQMIRYVKCIRSKQVLLLWWLTFLSFNKVKTLDIVVQVRALTVVWKLIVAKVLPSAFGRFVESVMIRGLEFYIFSDGKVTGQHYVHRLSIQASQWLVLFPGLYCIKVSTKQNEWCTTKKRF